VAGKVSAAQLVAEIAKGGGKAMLKTVEGATLTATKSDNTVSLADESGHTSNVTIADVNQSNGVIHIVDAVLLPK
jgi:uncharacterized surface protein with fasciclin (FAS1) repeats